MPLDVEYLRRHFASLSDEALLDIKRSDLVAAAQKCYDDELGRRELNVRPPVRRTAEREAPQPPQDIYDAGGPAGHPAMGEEKPDWLEDATEVYSGQALPGRAITPDLFNARDVLEAAAIPCFFDLFDMPDDTTDPADPVRRWRLMVPSELNQHATSVLERDIYNAEFEAEWKAQLENLSDEQLRATNPQVVLCGLFDRVERVTNTYEEELARRGLKPAWRA